MSKLRLNKQPGDLSLALGYTFRDVSLLQQALTHRSYGVAHNERFEFLGDSLLNFIIGEKLYQQFPQVDEGELTHMRAELVKGDTLAQLASDFNLGEFLILGSGESSSGGRTRASLQADAMEAIIAAIYLDSNLETCRERVLMWWKQRLANIRPGVNQKDAKTQLQELLQAQRKPLPEYRLTESRGADHCKEFFVTCILPRCAQTFKGVGKTRRAAEQEAAQQAVLFLKNQMTSHSDTEMQVKHD